MSDLVGLNAQSPDAFATIAKILSIRGQQAEVQQAQQSARQRAALANFDFNQFTQPDGSLDTNSMAADPNLRAAAGDQILDVLQHAGAVNQQNAAAKQTLLGLNKDRFGFLIQMFGGMENDPDIANDTDKGRQKVRDALARFGEIAGKEALPVVSMYAQQLDNVPKGMLPKAIQVAQMQANSVAQQLQLQTTPNFVNTGRELSQQNPLVPESSSIPKSLALSIPPGAQVSQDTDSLGNKYLTYRDAKGNVIGTAPLGGAGGPARFAPGERESLVLQAQQNFENVSANRQAASIAPQQLDQINKALKLSEQVSTGSFAQRRSEIESALGSFLPSNFQGLSDAAKLNELEKFTERIASDASKVLGVNAQTDAQRESISKQNANIGYTSEAIQNVLKYAKAQTLAMEAKGNAQEDWLRQPGNDITKEHDFETDFRKAYDPRVFQIEVMTPEERKKYFSTLSAQEKQDIRSHAQKLTDLGAIPSGL